MREKKREEYKENTTTRPSLGVHVFQAHVPAIDGSDILLSFRIAIRAGVDSMFSIALLRKLGSKFTLRSRGFSCTRRHAAVRKGAHAHARTSQQRFRGSPPREPRFTTIMNGSGRVARFARFTSVSSRR